MRGHKRRRPAARGAKNPFDIGRDRQPPRPARGVAQGQAGNLDRIDERGEFHQLRGDAVRSVFETAVAPTVPRHIGGCVVAYGQGGRAPDVARFFISQIQRLSRPVADRIVRPRRQLMFLAIYRPGVAPALRGDLKTEGRIGDDIDPRRWSRAARAQNGHIFAAAFGEPAHAVKVFQAALRARHLQFGNRRSASWGRSQPRRRDRHVLKLIGETTPLADHDDAGDRQQQSPRGGRDQLGAEHENMPGRALLAELQPRLARPDERLERRLEFLNIRYRALVEDHQIDGQTLHPPILHRLEGFARDAELIDVRNPHQDDRQIARYPKTPKVGLTSTTAFNDVRSGSQRGRGEDGVPGKTLELFRGGAVDAQMSQLHLGLRPREGGGSLESARIVMLVDQPQHVIAGGGDHGPKVDPRGRPGSKFQPTAQGEDRIEHGAGRAGQRAAVDRGDRRVDAAAAPDKPRAIGLEFPLSHRHAVDDREVRRPDLRLGRRSLPAVGHDGAQAGEVFGLDEQLRKGRMGEVGALRRQHQFGVGGHLDLACVFTEIREGDATDLGVVLGGHQHLQSGGQGSVPTFEFSVILVEGDLIGVRLGADRLIGRRPCLATDRVAQKDIRTPIVAGGVLAPARHR